MTTLETIKARAAAHGLTVLGLCHADRAPLPQGVATLALLGPDEPGFWPAFVESPEALDGASDPMDRWSLRVIEGMAQDLSASAFFPFGASPPHPFYTWALATGRIWSSPVQFLVHERAGLWVSFRGALGFAEHIPDVAAGESPCATCPAPCATACPASALVPGGYAVAACHDYLDTAAGQTCMQKGCAVRAACPVSANWGRVPDHSAFHMRHFHR